MGRSRKRNTLLGRNHRTARRAASAAAPLPRLGRRKALWRFVGALAFAPVAGTAWGQGPVVSYAPGGDPGYASVNPGYVVPAGGAGPLVAPGPMVPQGGIPIPSSSYFTPRLSTSSGIGDGLGWQDGYQSFGAWLPIGLNDESMVMYFDARGFTSFEEGGGGNFTLGYRYYMPGYDRFFGTYAAYDIDAGNAESNTFNRFAFGAESVGRFLTYRVNGYVPVEYDGQTVATGQVGDPFFQGNNILFLDRTLTRYQYGGVDAEVGGPMPLVGKYGVSGFVGGYWVTSDVDDGIGFKARAEANINDDLQIGGKLTTDEVFDTNVWVTLTLRSPRGSLSEWFRKDWLRQPSVTTQMDRAPEREYRVFTDVKTTESPTLAINPADGLPYLVLHVDPNGDGGTGTFENPASAINGPNGPNFDIVYVQPGELSTFGPVVLFDDQRLLSTAVPHFFDTQRGVFQLPGFTGQPTTLRNASSNTSSVVLLANNNEVSGFNIDGTGGVSFVTGQRAFHTGISGPGITSFDVNRNVFTNVTSGVNILHVGSGFGALEDNRVTGFGLGSSFGLSVSAINGSDLDLVVAGNVVTGFLGEDADASGTLTGAEDRNQNQVLDPGIGINVVANTGSTVNADVSDNVVTGNDTGVRLASLSGGNLQAFASQNFVSANAGSGFLLEASAATLAANFLGNTIAANGGPGIEVVGTLGSNVSITLGGAFPFSGNVIDANNGAGFAMTLASGSTGRLVARNNEFTNTLDDLDPLTRFTGQGIDVLVVDDAVFTNSVIDRNTITGNVADGILLTAQNVATISNVLIGNNDGDNNSGNLITGNLHGIHIVRTGNARIDNVNIIDNEVLNNRGSGLFVDADGGLADVTDFVALENTFTGNFLSGVQIDIAADAIVSSVVRNNIISANTLHGILTTQDRFTVDQGAITGVWAGNVIINNGANGILSGAPTDGLFVGTIDAPNTIALNTLAGVRIVGPGDATYGFNLIAQNGQGLNGNAATANSFGAGIDIEGVGSKTLLFVGNRILDNFGDGVEIASIDNGFFTFDLDFVDNIVARNTGRGYDALNTGDGLLELSIRGTAPGRSLILENGREGVYVVNTASNTQTQQGETPNFSIASENTDPTHGMDATGEVDAQTFMVFEFIGNDVVGNGEATGGAIQSKGLVLLVGTAGGDYGPFFEGGFASDGLPGVIATVNANRFSGNAGADFYVQSFTSTVNPATTAGTWNTTDFDIDNFEGDPLARLDLAFEGNVFEEIEVNNTGAFYNNDEATFKSRTDAADPDGPFETGTRRRNAQRLADRGGLIPVTGPNVPGEPLEFEYPGMGESTFRITLQTVIDVGAFNATIPNNVVLGDFFLIDDQPYTNFLDANGVIYSNNVDFGELPFGWSIF